MPIDRNVFIYIHKDSNKGIVNISWNLLNLPSVVTFVDGSSISYMYAADGTKLRTLHNIGGTTFQTDYTGNVLYENGIPKSWLTEAGYISMTDSKYHYYLQDNQGNNRVVVSETGAVEEVNHYYAFGGLFGNSSSVQPFKYNGKELDVKKGLNWYDYGARQYDAVLGRFISTDPLGEKDYLNGLYNYCANNPIKYIDPTGMFASPIYDLYGNLLGTDDEGLIGEAIIMDESNFKQGMSHEDALKYNLGFDGLIDDYALFNMFENYMNLPYRPDYDGYLTLEEANEWYRNGDGQPLFVALDKINLNGILSLGENYIGDIKSFNLLIHSKSLNDGLIYGHITLKRYPNHQVRAYSDKYDFEMHPWSNPLNWGRNIETIIGKKVAGKGKDYEINIYGNKTLRPILPWVK